MVASDELKQRIIELVVKRNEIVTRHGNFHLILNDAQISAMVLAFEKDVPTGDVISFSNKGALRYDRLLPMHVRNEFNEMYSNPFFPDVAYIGLFLKMHPNYVPNLSTKLESNVEDTLSHEAIHQTLFRIDELESGLLWDNELVIRENSEDDFLIRAGIREAPEETTAEDLGPSATEWEM